MALCTCSKALGSSQLFCPTDQSSSRVEPPSADLGADWGERPSQQEAQQTSHTKAKSTLGKRSSGGRVVVAEVTWTSAPSPQDMLLLGQHLPGEGSLGPLNCLWVWPLPGSTPQRNDHSSPGSRLDLGSRLLAQDQPGAPLARLVVSPHRGILRLGARSQPSQVQPPGWAPEGSAACPGREGN